MNEPSANDPLVMMTSQRKLSRRTFIDLIIKGGFLVTLTGFIMPALAYLWPVTKKGPAIGRKEVCRLDDIPLWGSKKVILVGSAILLVRTPNEVKALSAICTHLGCIVDWNDSKKEVVCPCHAGNFDYNGNVISGPPPKPLPSYKVNVIDGRVFVTI